MFTYLPAGKFDKKSPQTPERLAKLELCVSIRQNNNAGRHHVPSGSSSYYREAAVQRTRRLHVLRHRVTYFLTANATHLLARPSVWCYALLAHRVPSGRGICCLEAVLTVARPSVWRYALLAPYVSRETDLADFFQQFGPQVFVPEAFFFLIKVNFPRLLGVAFIAKLFTAELLTRQIEHAAPDHIVTVEVSTFSRDAIDLPAEYILRKECRYRALPQSPVCGRPVLTHPGGAGLGTPDFRKQII
ncbi:MAG: hypothetical protein K6G18_11455 [Treponema sp.]|nr:hypothetical protein [Treponema sp.]